MPKDVSVIVGIPMKMCSKVFLLVSKLSNFWCSETGRRPSCCCSWWSGWQSRRWKQSQGCRFESTDWLPIVIKVYCLMFPDPFKCYFCQCYHYKLLPINDFIVLCSFGNVYESVMLRKYSYIPNWQKNLDTLLLHELYCFLKCATHGLFFVYF